MSKITSDDIKHVAKLARLSIDNNELHTYTNDINGVLDLMGEMQRVDTDNVAASKHAWHANQRLRDDKITETNERDTMQKNAPKQVAGLYLVPKVVE